MRGCGASAVTDITRLRERVLRRFRNLRAAGLRELRDCKSSGVTDVAGLHGCGASGVGERMLRELRKCMFWGFGNGSVPARTDRQGAGTGCGGRSP